MNTSKQVNVMIGFLFLSFIVFLAYIVWEPARQSAAEETRLDTYAKRGAELYVANCRNCHGMVGEGHIGPPLDNEAFLIIGEHNDEGGSLALTPEGEVATVRSYLHDTIACGRTNTFMPVWSEDYGGPLSTVQIDYLVELITQGRWDLVEEIGHELDSHQEPPATPEDILVQDPATLTATANNCGQFSPEARGDIYARRPLGSGGGGEPTGTATPPPAEEGQLAVELADFSVNAPDTFEAGEVEIVVRNVGAVLHNLRVIRTDLPADELPMNSSGAQVDESQLDIVASSEDFAGGQSVTLTANLEPGEYVLICNVAGHYQLGMATTLTVQ